MSFRRIIVEKPGSPSEILEHHGIKGMKWGVRKKDDTGGQRPSSKIDSVKTAGVNKSTKAYMSAVLKDNAEVTPAQFKQNLQQAKKAFNEKHGIRPLTPTEKKVLIGAGVVVTVAAIAGGAYYLNKRTGFISNHISLEDYNRAMRASQLSWGKGFLTKESFVRPGFELPAGQSFDRISTVSETEHGPFVFATHSAEDYNRYIAGFTDGRDPRSMRHVSFKSTTPIKVPHISEVLNSTREVLANERGVSPDHISEEDVTRTYRHLSSALSASDGLENHSWGSPRGKSVIASLTKKGYGAIVDEMDAGVIGESPLVVFNQGNLTSPVSKRISVASIVKSTYGLTQMAGQK